MPFSGFDELGALGPGSFTCYQQENALVLQVQLCRKASFYNLNFI